MTEERFSEYTYGILKKAGWFPDRHALSTIELPDGYDLLESARLVLDEFGGLSVDFVYETEYGKIFDKVNIVIDPSRCAEEIEREGVAWHSQQIGHPLYRIGVYYDDSWDPTCSTLLIDDLGRIFLIAFWADTFLGETFDIALVNLLAGRKGKFIDEKGHW